MSKNQTKKAEKEPELLLVTGITGHTGKFFIWELQKHKYEGKIRCVLHDRASEEVLKKSGLNYEVIIGDMSDQDLLNKACEGVDTILEIYNIHYSKKMIKAAIKNKVKRAILVHTTGIYSKYKMASAEYEQIEGEVIQMCRKSNIDLTILRPTMIYGDICDHNISKFIKMVDKLRIFPLIAGGRAKIQPVNARDLGQAYYKSLMHPEATKNNNYNISGSEEVSLKSLMQIISSELGKKTIFVPVPIWLALVAAYLLKIFTFGKKDVVEKVLRMDEARVFSFESAARDFGYEPMDFRKGISAEVEEYIMEKRKMSRNV